MQPCNTEMQGLNSPLNSSSQISLQDPNSNISQQIPHFDATSHDDFLEQMLSSCSWPDLNPNKPLWEASTPNPDLSDQTTPSNHNAAAFAYDEHSTLASKFRNHQISAASNSKNALMFQHQLLHMPLSLHGNDVVDASSFQPPNPLAGASVQALYSGFPGSLHAADQTQHFQHSQGSSNQMQGASTGGATNQAPSSGRTGGAAVQPRQRVRARRGQATDPHSIAERLRRERIAERMKALQELVPNANKTDKASMLDEIIDYVKFLQLQVKVLSMSRLGGAAAVAPLVADISSEGGDCIQANGNSNGSGGHGPNSNINKTTATVVNDSLTMTEQQVAKLMEEDMGSAMQYLQGKGLCLMPLSLATAISTATCPTRKPLIPTATAQIPTKAAVDGPLSPSMSVLTVQSTVAGIDAAVRDAASFSKP